MALPFYDELRRRMMGMPGGMIPGMPDPLQMQAMQQNIGSMGQAPPEAAMPEGQPGMIAPQQAAQDTQSPGILQRLFGGLGGGSNQSGLVEDRKTSTAGYLLPLMMTQIGAALMQAPEDRGKVFANLPATMLAAIKMANDDRRDIRENKRLDLYSQKMMGGADKVSTDQLLAKAIQSGDQATIDRIVAAKEKPQYETPKYVQTVGPDGQPQWGIAKPGLPAYVKPDKEPKPPAEGKTEFDIVRNALTEKLGRTPTAMELDAGIMERKKSISTATSEGKIEGAVPLKQVMVLRDKILSGGATLDDVTNSMGIPAKNRVMEEVIKASPDYDFIQAQANRNWFKTPTTQRLIRRTESIVVPGGPIDEAMRFAKEVDNPAGTPINAVTGKLGVALGNSRRQLLDLVHGLNAEEIQQIMGAQGGGERFLEFTKQLSDPNQSVEQYINAAKEMRYLIVQRQVSNVRGTPEQKKWEGMADNLQVDLPYMRPEVLKQSQSDKQGFLRPPAATQQMGSGDFATQANQRQMKINAMPPGPQKNAAQQALNKVMGQ
jgi:hypothetical protein